MPDLLDAVKLPVKHRKLVCEFLLIFSRFEFAMKKAGYAFEPCPGAVGVDRKTFAEDVKKSLTEKLRTPQARERLNPLLTRPPMKQLLEGRTLKWKEVSAFEGKTIDAKFLLDSAYRVRNNLFHGGKWPPEPARDEELLRAALALIEICLEVHDGVAKGYFSVI